MTGAWVRLHSYAHYLDDGTGAVVDPYVADPDAPARAEDIYAILYAYEDALAAIESARSLLRALTGPDDSVAAAVLAMADAVVAKSGVPSGSREPRGSK